MIFHVTCSTDDNYVQHCMAMLCSLFENNKGHQIIVHLLHHGLSVDNQNLMSSLARKYGCEMCYYDIDDSVFSKVQLNSAIKFNGAQMYSMTTYYRILLPSLLPDDIHRILYLDCDIILMHGVSELFELDMENYGVAAVKDGSPYDSYHRFKMGLGLQHAAFCAGMMMLNLDYWRNHDSQEALLEYVTRQWDYVYMQDQDALNCVFRDSWIQLPYKWGRTPLSVAPVDKSQRWFDIEEYVCQPCIIHYAAHVKPWLDVWFPLQEHYWKYVYLSGFPNPKRTHANRDLRIKIYKSVIRYLVNKNVRPLIPDFVELVCKDVLYVFLFVINILRPSRFKLLMLKRWCQKYGV